MFAPCPETVVQGAGTDFSERTTILHKANAGPDAAAGVLVSPAHCKPVVNDANFLIATPAKRARRKSMTRRSGQAGYIERKGNAFYVRFWMDVLGQEARKHVSVRICPVNGPGRMTKPERERKAREIITESGADTEAHFEKVEAVNLGIAFRQQAEKWLNHVQTRQRKPIKPATAKSWENCTGKWLNPLMGDMPLSSVGNLAVKGLVAKMVAERRAPKTIKNVIQVVKMVVASAVNDEGEQIYPRKWNHEFIDLPEVKDQHTPSFSCDDVQTMVASAKGQYRMLYALLAGTGMRIGEASGLEIGKCISQDASTIMVQQSVWSGAVQLPKTKNAAREIDLHSDLADMLKEFIGERKSGFLFVSRAGNPLCQTNVLKRSLHPTLKAMGREKAGFHAFRRFRTSWLRKNRAPEDLIRFWLGHANKSVTDGYSKLSDDVEFRRECAEKVGLGFAIPAPNAEVVPSVPKSEGLAQIEQALVIQA
jgi:integrase